MKNCFMTRNKYANYSKDFKITDAFVCEKLLFCIQ